MDGLKDYVEWLGDVDFRAKPFNDVDAIILCLISYFDLAPVLDENGEARVSDCMKHVDGLGLKITGGNMGNREVFAAAAASKRFGELYISKYVDEMDKELNLQFAAVTFTYEDEWSFIAYRGTDNSLVGWKEDFMIGYTETLAQRKAADYAVSVIKAGDEADLDGIPQTRFLKSREKLAMEREEALRTWYVGGHSKGGNLALYAACKVPDDIFGRVERFYDLDGPGFAKEVMDRSLIERAETKTTRIIPEYDVIGRIMEVKLKDTKVIVSSEDGVLEHNIASWTVDHGKLGLSERTEPKENLVNDTLRDWIENMPFDERVRFIEEIFDALAADGAVTLEDLTTGGLGGLEAILGKLKGLSEESKKTLADLQAVAASAALKKIGDVPGTVLEGTKNILSGLAAGVAEVAGVAGSFIKGLKEGEEEKTE